MHDMGIYHRDVKMMNIFVRQDSRRDIRFLLGDFGSSCLLKQDQMMNDRLGTMHWMAPEVINRQQNGLKADVWSMGVLLHELISGEHPYDGDSFTELRANYKEQEITFKE